jgi:periplasmic protein TonB
MPLRCLIFSSNEAGVQPIWQVLTDLGIEGEYCASAVDAVERVTTQLFQIVITDWDDQPEAAFLLKTARDLKAAHRPLTLAIVSDDARLPEALKAGANSILVKPISAEAVRDTMSTACELLRAKQQPAAPSAPPASTVTAAMAVAAGAVSAPASPQAAATSISAKSGPPSVKQSPEKTFRAGEFLQPPSLGPGAQFATEEKEPEVDNSVELAGADEVESLTELEPMAAAVDDSSAQEQEADSEPQPALTGWASLQARLMKTAPAPPVEQAPAKNELLGYGETPSQVAAPAGPAQRTAVAEKKESQPEPGSEAALFAYIEGEQPEHAESAPKSHAKHLRRFVGLIAAAGVVLVAMPRTRPIVLKNYRSAVRAGGNWLNPPPAAIPQSAPQHDSFAQSGDEYKLPVASNIPDATTDPSQIRVVPVIDPTAKPDKNADANGAPVPAASDNGPTDQGQAATAPTEFAPVPPTSGNLESSPTPVANTTVDAAKMLPLPAVAPTRASPPESQAAATPRPALSQTQQAPLPPAPPPANNLAIPSSLRSQIASMTPNAGGNKPPEAAMSSIEPVVLQEAALRDLLTQPANPEYPAAAKASGQKGSVVLQVLVARDGSVQEAKFLQGSLMFARAATDAVKLWHFKPYLMNGRAVSVQSVITLNFKPPA